MEPLFYSTGQVARQLGTTLATIRHLCENGAIAAETTPGGHLRISAPQVERLKRDGLPPMPRPLPTESAPRARNGKSCHNGYAERLVETSAEALSAAEQVAITRSLLEKRKIDRELEETEDWFRERADQQAQIDADRRQAEESQQAEFEAGRLRRAWEDRWLMYALDSIPSEAHGQAENEVHREVCKILACIAPEAAVPVAQRLVDAAVGKALRPWRRRRDAARAIDDAVTELPSDARNYFEPTVWQLRATQRARAATESLSDAADFLEIEAAARAAVGQVTQEYLDAELRRSVRDSACPLLLQQHFSDTGKKMAADAIDNALAAMPPGSRKSELEAACKTALAPFREAVAQQQAQDQDRAVRESVLSFASLTFPWDFGIKDREAALGAARAALGRLPIGTTKSNMEKARDEALRPFLDAHNQRERKKPLVDIGVREIFSTVLKLQQDWDFEGVTAWTLEAEVKEPIRKRLEAEITGAESEDDVKRKVRRFVRDELLADDTRPS